MCQTCPSAGVSPSSALAQHPFFHSARRPTLTRRSPYRSASLPRTRLGCSPRPLARSRPPPPRASPSNDLPRLLSSPSERASCGDLLGRRHTPKPARRPGTTTRTRRTRPRRLSRPAVARGVPPACSPVPVDAWRQKSARAPHLLGISAAPACQCPWLRRPAPGPRAALEHTARETPQGNTITVEALLPNDCPATPRPTLNKQTGRPATRAGCNTRIRDSPPRRKARRHETT